MVDTGGLPSCSEKKENESRSCHACVIDLISQNGGFPAFHSFEPRRGWSKVSLAPLANRFCHSAQWFIGPRRNGTRCCGSSEPKAPLAAPQRPGGRTRIRRNAPTEPPTQGDPPPGSAPGTLARDPPGEPGSPSRQEPRPRARRRRGSGSAWGRRSRGNFLFGFDCPRQLCRGFAQSLWFLHLLLRSPSPSWEEILARAVYTVPVDAATGGLKSEHVVVCFQIQGCFWGKRLIQGKGTGIYNLDRYLRSNGIPQSCEWNDLGTRLMRDSNLLEPEAEVSFVSIGFLLWFLMVYFSYSFKLVEKYWNYYLKYY